MWPLSAAARIALGQSHDMTARVTIYSSTAGVVPDLPIAGGQVDADATSHVRRSATLHADPRYWPASPLDLLAPFGSEAVIEYGIVLSSGLIEWVPLGRFVLEETSRTRPPSTKADLTVKLVDRAARVAEDRLEAPAQTVSGATTVAEIRRLIQETLGSAVPVNDLTGSSQLAAVIEIPKDRWADGVEKLALSIGAECFFDVLGQGLIRPTPTLADPPVWVVTTGGSGSMLTAVDKLSRGLVYNRVVASGQRTDSTLPVYAAVSDTDPASPTYYGGPFGKKPRFYSSGLLTTVGQCTTAATALLNRAKGVGVQVDLEQLVNPALEPGDVITVIQDDTTTTHLLDKVPIPLTPDGTQKLGTRTNNLPPEH